MGGAFKTVDGVKKLIFIMLMVFSCSAYGQLDTVDLSITYFGIPSTPGEADFLKNEAYKMNLALTELDTILDPLHAFIYFGDSAVSKSYTTSWAHLTNAADSMFIQVELDGFSMSGDTITVVYGGDYEFDSNFAHDGDNLETVSIRFYNVTQTTGIPVAGANTMRAANNFMTTVTNAYGEDIMPGDEIVIQYKGDANGTAVFKNGVVEVHRVHGL